MGFNKQGRREAQAAEKAALAQQQNVFNQTQEMYRQYREGYAKRNAGIIALQGQAQDWLDRYSRGVDVSKLNPALNQTLMDAANTMTRTTQVANRIGDRAMVAGDKNYQTRLNSLAQRQMFRDMAGLNEQGLMAERANQTGILMDTSNFLNADQMAGLGLQGNLFGMANTMTGIRSAMYDREIAKSNQMMGNIMGLINGGITGAASVATMGGAKGFKWWGK